jgi:hypothetical protein
MECEKYVRVKITGVNMVNGRGELIMNEPFYLFIYFSPLAARQFFQFKFTFCRLPLMVSKCYGQVMNGTRFSVHNFDLSCWIFINC